jgi:hypothetical protein
LASEGRSRRRRIRPQDKTPKGAKVIPNGRAEKLPREEWRGEAGHIIRRIFCSFQEDFIASERLLLKKIIPCLVHELVLYLFEGEKDDP